MVKVLNNVDKLLSKCYHYIKKSEVFELSFLTSWPNIYILGFER